MARNDISIGQMRQTGTLRNNSPIPNNSGGYDDSYTDVVTCRGRLRQQSGSKRLENGEIVQNKGWEWICRFQSGIALDVDSIWVIGGQIYRITNWEKVDQQPHWYKFVLSVWQ